MTDTTKKPEVDTNTVTLKSICTSMKVDPKEARAKLRSADAKAFPSIVKHKAGHAWSWPKNSPALKEVRTGGDTVEAGGAYMDIVISLVAIMSAVAVGYIIAVAMN